MTTRLQGPFGRRPDRTRDEIEEERWAARGEAEHHATFPQSVRLNNVDIPLAKWQDLQSMGQQSLRTRALNLRDTINRTNSNFFEHYRHLVLRPHAGEEVLSRWFIDVQLTLTSGFGYKFTPADFGAPANDENLAPFSPRGFTSQFGPPPVARSFPWSQYGVEDKPAPRARQREEPPYSHSESEAARRRQLQQMDLARAPREPPPYAQDTDFPNQLRTVPMRRDAPAYSQQDLLDGRLAREQDLGRHFDPMQQQLFDGVGSRFDEAALIRQHQKRGNNIFDDSPHAAVAPSHSGMVSNVQFG